LLEDKIKKKTIFNEKRIQKNKPSQLGSIYWTCDLSHKNKITS
jgi:hypothetical protein